MARLPVSDELWGLVEPLIPKVSRRPRCPGRRRLGARQVLTGILFVLQAGDPVGVPAAGDGLRLRDDLRARVAGVSRGGDLAAAARTAADEAERGRADRVGASGWSMRSHRCAGANAEPAAVRASCMPTGLGALRRGRRPAVRTRRSRAAESP